MPKSLNDKYYKKPIFYDYLISLVIVGILFFLNYKGVYYLPGGDKSGSLASDIGAIGLTVSGFILTIIAILVTLKSGQLLSGERLTNISSPFKIFLSSSLYDKAIEILKTGVVSLIIISVLIFIIKLIFVSSILKYIFYFNVVGLIIIVATFLRCFFVLGLIMKMQKEPHKKELE